MNCQRVLYELFPTGTLPTWILSEDLRVFIETKTRDTIKSAARTEI